MAEEEADALSGLSSVVKACLGQAEAMQSTGLEQDSCNSRVDFALAYNNYQFAYMFAFCHPEMPTKTGLGFKSTSSLVPFILSGITVLRWDFYFSQKKTET